MTREEKLNTVTEKWFAVFKKNNITLEMFDTVTDYLIELGALQYCGGVGGCNKACPDGQYCTRPSKNCICVKDD